MTLKGSCSVEQKEAFLPEYTVLVLLHEYTVYINPHLLLFLFKR